MNSSWHLAHRKFKPLFRRQELYAPARNWRTRSIVRSGAGTGIACSPACYDYRPDPVPQPLGTDCPFNPDGGPMFIRNGIRAIDSLKLSAPTRNKVYSDNAIKMLRLDPALKKISVKPARSKKSGAKITRVKRINPSPCI